MVNNGVAKEMARIVLPLATYTEWYWKIDLHNLFHFFKLRLEKHAQEEIRLYAQEMFKMVKELFPISCQAFEDYILNAITFSAEELRILSLAFASHKDSPIGTADEWADYYAKESNLNKREKTEFLNKIKSIAKLKHKE